MICNNCNENIPDNFIICPICGAKVDVNKNMKGTQQKSEVGFEQTQVIVKSKFKLSYSFLGYYVWLIGLPILIYVPLSVSKEGFDINKLIHYSLIAWFVMLLIYIIKVYREKKHIENTEYIFSDLRLICRTEISGNVKMKEIPYDMITKYECINDPIDKILGVGKIYIYYEEYNILAESEYVERTLIIPCIENSNEVHEKVRYTLEKYRENNL